MGPARAIMAGRWPGVFRNGMSKQSGGASACAASEAAFSRSFFFSMPAVYNSKMAVHGVGGWFALRANGQAWAGYRTRLSSRAYARAAGRLGGRARVVGRRQFQLSQSNGEATSCIARARGGAGQ
jgi:hypothetical protein